MATSKSSGLGGFNNQLGVGRGVGAVGDGEPEGDSLPELQGSLRDEPKAGRGDEGHEERDARRVGSARVGDEEDLDQGLDRIGDDGDELDDDEQRVDPNLDADIEGGE
jgi:hypothetical protein